MHNVNLDLLRTLPHHPDGRPKDPHASHRHEIEALVRAARKHRWQQRLAALRSLLSARAAPGVQPCSDQHP